MHCLSRAITWTYQQAPAAPWSGAAVHAGPHTSMYRIMYLCCAFTHRDARGRVGEGDVFCKYVNVYALGLWIGKDAYITMRMHIGCRVHTPNSTGHDCLEASVSHSVTPSQLFHTIGQAVSYTYLLFHTPDPWPISIQ